MAARSRRSGTEPRPGRQSLRRSSDLLPGWRRRRRGRGFAYFDARGRPIRAEEALARIRALAIPPAYREVWICPDPQGHLQATARDARGRKQYRYHPQWQQRRAARKFQRIARLGRRLPAIRRRLARDLKLKNLPRERVLAAVVTLLDLTGQRIGGREYLRQNGSYGLTTLCDRHLRDHGRHALLRFRGKSGVEVEVEIDHPQLLRTLRACRDLPGDELFQYQDADGAIRAIGAVEVNEYLRRIAGADFTAKDFRTWKASVHLLNLLCRERAPGSSRRLNAAIKEVACELAHTPAVCRRSYIDPAVIEAYLAGALESSRPVVYRGLRVAERRYLALIDDAEGSTID
jgi:DNA topoisomerase-1